MNTGWSKPRDVHPGLILITLSVGMLMSSLDTTIVNVALAKLQVAMGASTDAVQWVITAYLLALVIALPAAGWCADNFGYKATFLSSLALFTVGSFLCSLSEDLTTLILSRILQGLGAGLMLPLGSAFLVRVFPREKLGLAVGLFSIPAVASTSFGPTLGGWLIDQFSWQTMFTINLPIGFLGLVLGSLLLPEFKKDQRTPFDLPSFLSLGVALTLLVFALSNAGAAWNTDGWTSALMLTCFGVSTVGFCLFAIFQSTPHPLLELSLFRGRDFSISVFLFFIFGFGLFGSDFLLPLYLQNGLGYTPTQAGMVFIPFGIVMILSNVVGGRMNDLWGPKIPGLMGIAARAYGLYRFTFLTPQSDVTEIVLTVCLLGVGMGLLMTPIQTTAMAARPKDKAAQASGLVSIARQLGGSFGVAILSAVLVARDAFHRGAISQGMNVHNPVYQEIVARLSAHAMTLAGGSPNAVGSLSQGIIVSHIQTQAFVSGINDVFFITMVISILTSVPFLFVRSPSRVPRSPVPAKPSALGEKS